MTRTLTTAAVILILTAALGCNTDMGLSARLPQRTSVITGTPPEPPATTTSTSTEIDLIEQMTTQRQAYRRSLESLAQFYDTAGNHEKTTWARQEMQALDRIPMYRYIVAADMPVNLKASERVPAADQMFEEARKIERLGGTLPVLKDEEYLRAALDKYTQLIRDYPTSDKIDDAAFRIGGIHEYFKDYTLALSSYQRVYQWDPTTPLPARFKAAEILDRKLHRRAEALQLYQEAVVKEGQQYTMYRINAERRVKELTTSSDSASK